LVANNTAIRTKQQPVSIPPAAYVIGFLILAGLAGFWYLDRASKQPVPPPPPLTGPAKAYVRNLKLSDVNMTAHESYMQQGLVEITGKIENTGDRVLEVVEINCIFKDAYDQMVLRERVPIVNKKMGGLAPGEVKTFRLPFDHIPDSWNQALPDMVIARIDFS